MAVAEPRVDLLGALVRAVGQTSAQAGLFNQALAGQLGIGATDLECLALLQELGTASAGQLADLLGLTTGAITGVVDRLEAGGFVARESDPGDRRRVIVRTQPGRAADVEHAYAPLVRAAGEALADTAEPELRRLLDGPRRLAEEQRRETARLRMERAADGVPLTAPLGGLEAASLEFATGAAELRLQAAELAGELYRAVFEGPQPAVRVQNGSVTFRYRRMSLFDWGKHAGSVSLNAAIPWTIAINGGAANVAVDARGLELRGLAIGGGASKVRLLLPAPRGTVQVRIGGGVSRVDVCRPFGAPAQLQVRGGASRLQFDGQRFGAVGGELRLASPGWELATDRYDIEVRGGASRLEVEEEAAE